MQPQVLRWHADGLDVHDTGLLEAVRRMLEAARAHQLSWRTTCLLRELRDHCTGNLADRAPSHGARVQRPWAEGIVPQVHLLHAGSFYIHTGISHQTGMALTHLHLRATHEQNCPPVGRAGGGIYVNARYVNAI